MESLLGDLAAQVVAGIASARRLDADVVKGALSEAPLTAKRAAALGLIDGTAYRDALQGGQGWGVVRLGAELGALCGSWGGGYGG
jgi:hypothetical protein